jgi:hypothetical protein
MFNTIFRFNLVLLFLPGQVKILSLLEIVAAEMAPTIRVSLKRLFKTYDAIFKLVFHITIPYLNGKLFVFEKLFMQMRGKHFI